MIENSKHNGKFAKGISGNLSGRPPGSRNRASILMESLLEGEAEQLLRKAIELAKPGDTRALSLCLDRLMPLQKDRRVQFDLAPICSLHDIPLGMMSIEEALSQGILTPPEGEIWSRILTAHANALSTADLLLRVEKLEAGPSKHDNQVLMVKEYH